VSDELGRGPVEILRVGFAQQVGVELISAHLGG
jgi:hypothetical protein